MKTWRNSFLALALLLLASPLAAQPAYDAFSASGGGTGTQTWTHTPVGTPRGVGVWVYGGNGTDEISTCTYGGVSMTETANSPQLLTTGEAGQVSQFFLGASLPTGAQTVECTATGATTTKVGMSITWTAGGDTELVSTALILNANLQDPSVTLSLSGETCAVAFGAYSGHNTASVSPLTNWTERIDSSAGTESIILYTYDIVGSTDVTVGWDDAAANDVALLAMAIKQSAGGGGATPKPILLLGVGGEK